MNYFKEITFSICAAVLLFGIIKSILPNNFYIKYMRLLFSLIFVVLIVKGMYDVSFQENFNFDNLKIDGSSDSIEKQLSNQTKIYLNELLEKNKYAATCQDVTVINESDNYYILNITIKSSLNEKSKVINYLRKITGLKEGQIYVEP